jgi:hypothetical protein
MHETINDQWLGANEVCCPLSRKPFQPMVPVVSAEFPQSTV